MNVTESSCGQRSDVTPTHCAETVRVLVIEDDRRIAGILRQALGEDGHSVSVCHRGDHGLAMLEDGGYDVAVLDMMLPELDGFSLLRRLRSGRNETPVLALTARDAVPDMVRGLDMGADDYLTKPFQVEVLLARVRAVSRRGHKATDNNVIAGDLTLYRGERVLRRGHDTVLLTKKEYLLLELLMRRANQVVTRDQLIEAGWGYTSEVSDNSVDFYISSLRSKVDTRGEPSRIRTLRSLGYCFTASHAP